MLFYIANIVLKSIELTLFRLCFDYQFENKVLVTINLFITLFIKYCFKVLHYLTEVSCQLAVISYNLCN